MLAEYSCLPSLAATDATVAQEKKAARPAAKAAAKDGPTLETIKKLAGDWVLLGEDGKPTDPVVSSIKVTAGGSAVMEVLFPGTEKEMVTMYTQGEDGLVLIHYCMLGNQPRMKAERGKEANQLAFKFVGGGNLDPDKDNHMHEATYTIVEDNHLQTEWVRCEEGKACETHKFDLVRKQK